MRHPFLVTLIFLLSVSSVCFGQFYQAERIEFELGEKDEDFLIIPAWEEGLFLSRKVKNKETKRDFKYELTKLDTTLAIQWQLNDYVDLEYVLIGYDYIGPYVYFLYNSSLKRKKYKAIRFHSITQAKEVFDIEMEFEFQLTEFEVIDETLVFGGYVNNRTTFIAYKFNEPSPIALPGFRNEPSEIMQLEMEPDKNVFNVLLSYLTPEKKRSIAIKSYNLSGELIKDFILRPQGDYGLLYGRSIAVNDEMHLVVGTYTQRKSDLSRGIFVSTVDQDASHVINYYNYADLKNFFNYMKAKKEIRVKKKIERRKIKGKKNKFYYKLIVDDIIELDDQYIMIGEAFYPKYNYGSTGYSSFSPYSYGGNGFFEGYKYTHAVIIGFDKQGRILWDNSFEIQDVITYNLYHYVNAIPSKDGILLLYLYENNIRTKLIRGSKVLDVQENVELKNPYDDLTLSKEVTYSTLEKWYANNLFAYGIQKIGKVNASIADEKREVFFINKISIKK